jgi:hypothetical protein
MLAIAGECARSAKPKKIYTSHNMATIFTVLKIFMTIAHLRNSFPG